MRLSDFLENVGHPVAYYPALASTLGGVNAAVLFCQLYYWSKRSTSDLGVHKTTEELKAETGMSRAEQETARKALKKRGVLIEKHIRLEHKMYYRLDLDVLERLMEMRSSAAEEGADPESENQASPKAKNSRSRKRDSSIRESDIPALADAGIIESGAREPSAPEAANLAFVNEEKTTAETTAAEARESGPVDNSAAVAADSKNEKANTELELIDLLIALERERGKDLSIDRSRDRAHVLTWIGKGVTPNQLRAAHVLAVAARKRDSDDRPAYAGFVSTFIDDAMSPAAAAPADPMEWHLTQVGTEARGAELGMRERKQDEDWRYYRVLVARASREPRAIEHVLTDAQRFNAVDLYQFARATFGDALMPVDDFAS
ncbi:hypothetical protein DIE15_12325 [Burkholderia sp. Bp9031]|uniref:hypothetical protein n=1 Tax=Burkholderia sp. Bp9031 TaxID=2184566 RepID=UPI000F5DFE08|nr:hypothetical protein [Burkholderia sp. Bp9031]RQZ17252.1 hypothetical protein DIE15_12325 [Burkholderia sp. Bp9031]